MNQVDQRVGRLVSGINLMSSVFLTFHVSKPSWDWTVASLQELLVTTTRRLSESFRRKIGSMEGSLLHTCRRVLMARRPRKRDQVPTFLCAYDKGTRGKMYVIAWKLKANQLDVISRAQIKTDCIGISRNRNGFQSKCLGFNCTRRTTRCVAFQD